MTLAYSTPEAPDPNTPQRAATIPHHDVWVSASAGSGKTKVLTDRVLRLMLPDPHNRWQGADPHRILCITFTKAAAALMALRVQSKLGEWAVMSDASLSESLNNLLDSPPSEEVKIAARKLFSTVLDTTGGLSIMTIHSFCQSILGRFAIEAGITPGFTILEDTRANDILRRIVDELILGVRGGNDPDLLSSFQKIATYLDLEKLRETLHSVLSKSREISEFLLSLEQTLSVEDKLRQELGYQSNFKPLISDNDLLEISRILTREGGKNEKDSGQKIADWLTLNEKERLSRILDLQDAFLRKTDKKIRSLNKNITENYSNVFILRHTILEQISLYLDNLAIARQASQTDDLLKIVTYCLKEYQAQKQKMNALDFNDLILKTRHLLESETMDWVHFKLDEGIDHILVDEAQDTNPHQWAIIRRLSDEFLSGLGNDSRLRSLFIVGDEKQSIFSFHGADPDTFKNMRDFFESRSKSAERTFSKIPLETSFRSTRPVLQLVDEVFNQQDLSKRLGIPSHSSLTHFAHRDKDAGLIELWDATIIDKKDSDEVSIKWKIPILSPLGDKRTIDNPSLSPLANKIAKTISGWLDRKEVLQSTGRAIQPRDILILVRTRTNFVSDLVRQLKLQGIPVSGVDRMKLTDQIAVMDCLALAKFARFPNDDLSLACLLRSPFIRISEDRLMELALGRNGSLWDSVQRHMDTAILSWLHQIIQKSKTEKPFDFFDDVMNSSCPFNAGTSGWGAFSTCLGSDCLDPLDEFISFCLAKEEDGVFSLEELISVIQSSDIEIKRDTEDGEKESLNQVRIMTIHASKGLESPIVFLPDTMKAPNRGKIDALQWIKSGDNTPFIPLWAARSGDGCKTYEDLKIKTYDKMISEYMRLLYVALTRAKDRLYIAGQNKTLQFNDFSWYHLISMAFQTLPHRRIGDVLRIETEQLGATTKNTSSSLSSSDEGTLPSWIKSPAIDDTLKRLTVIQPSQLAIRQDRVQSPLNIDGTYRFRRGNLTHKLFQILPDLPKERREQAALVFLSRMAKDLPPEIHRDIVNETLKILNDPIFSNVFGENSMAEVPISGDMGDERFISGQIDRLAIGHNHILIVDFKTNRPSPKDLKDIPEAYIQQLNSYKTALHKIFPDKEILCALLWTDRPILMPISV